MDATGFEPSREDHESLEVARSLARILQRSSTKLTKVLAQLETTHTSCGQAPFYQNVLYL
jgi:hypothetical protein